PTLSPLSLHDALPISAETCLNFIRDKNDAVLLTEADDRFYETLRRHDETALALNQFHNDTSDIFRRHSFDEEIVELLDRLIDIRSEEHTSELQSRFDL